MAAAKEIRTKIASLSSTQKITSAMQMVAASKMRKSQERMARGKPYARRIRAVVGHIANAAPEYKHMYMQEREVRKVGYIVVSTGISRRVDFEFGTGSMLVPGGREPVGIGNLVPYGLDRAGHRPDAWDQSSGRS